MCRRVGIGITEYIRSTEAILDITNFLTYRGRGLVAPSFGTGNPSVSSVPENAQLRSYASIINLIFWRALRHPAIVLSKPHNVLHGRGMMVFAIIRGVGLKQIECSIRRMSSPLMTQHRCSSPNDPAQSGSGGAPQQLFYGRDFTDSQNASRPPVPYHHFTKPIHTQNFNSHYLSHL